MTRAARSCSPPSATTSSCRSRRIRGRRARRISTPASSFTLVRDHLTPDGVFVQWIDLDLVDAAAARVPASRRCSMPFRSVRIYRPVLPQHGALPRFGGRHSRSRRMPPARSRRHRWSSRAPGCRRPRTSRRPSRSTTSGARLLAAELPSRPTTATSWKPGRSRVTAPLGYQGADRLFEPTRSAADARSPSSIACISCGACWPIGTFLARRRVVEALGDPRRTRDRCAASSRSRPNGGRGRAGLRAALAAGPGGVRSAHRVAAARAGAPRRRRAGVVALAAPLEDPARAVVEGWRYEAARDWAALAGARVPPRHGSVRSDAGLWRRAPPARRLAGRERRAATRPGRRSASSIWRCR